MEETIKLNFNFSVIINLIKILIYLSQFAKF